MRLGSRVPRAVPRVRLRSLIGIVLVALAVSVTFLANRPLLPVTVDILIARTNVASGSVVGDNREAFFTVALPNDSPLLALLVTEAGFANATDAVFLRTVREGEPLLAAWLGQRQAQGTVLTLQLARVAALDGDIQVGDRLRVLTTGTLEPNGMGVEVLAVRSIGGGLGRQEQIALTVRVKTASLAAKLFGASTSDTLLLVRQGES